MASQPRPRDPLSRERVLDAAVGLADERGIDALTMRGLAQELGVEAMTLYYYVRNKDEILTGIVDRVVSEFELPSSRDDWKTAIRTTAVSAYHVLLRHRWAAALVLSGSGVSQARLRYMDAILGTLRRAGFSAEMTDHAYHALDSHIMGFTLWVVGMNLGTDEELAALAGDFLEQVRDADMPHLVEHVEQHMKPPDPGEKPEFEFGLDLILDGLERMRDAAASSRR
jgi:AcrR family transcriptional regulator